MRKRTIKYTVRFNEAEHQHFREQVVRTGYSGEAYIRDLIAKQNIKPRSTKELEDIRRQLSAIGNNINQLAKKANSSGYVNQEEVRQIITFQKEVWSLIKQL